MNEVVIAPSILAMDFTKMTEQMQELNESKAKWIHFDVLDGHFAPNLSFGPEIFKGLRASTDKVLDVHLMVTDAYRWIPIFAKLGADMITVHAETFFNQVDDIKRAINHIHECGCQAGIAIKPHTTIQKFEPLLELVEMILVMGVEPGFGGQQFMEDMLFKVDWLNYKREEHNLNFRIEMDGGINKETAVYAFEHGCDTLVAGSYVFKNGIKESVEDLLTCLQQYA